MTWEEVAQDDLEVDVVGPAFVRSELESEDMGWLAFLWGRNWQQGLLENLENRDSRYLWDRDWLDHLCLCLWRKDCSSMCIGGVHLEEDGQRWDLENMDGWDLPHIACEYRKSTEDMDLGEDHQELWEFGQE